MLRSDMMIVTLTYANRQYRPWGYQTQRPARQKLLKQPQDVPPMEYPDQYSSL